MDTTTITSVTHVVDTSFINSVQHDLDPTHWFLLYSGLLFYWLKDFNAARQAANGASYIRQYVKDNWIELPTSILACVILAVMAAKISTDIIDLHGILAVFMVGYSSSSILNGLITQYGRPAAKTIAKTIGPALAIITTLIR